MQSTGQTSTQLLSLTPMHGWAITYATAHRSSPGFSGRESGCATDPLWTAHALVVDELAGAPSIASAPWTRGTNAARSGATVEEELESAGFAAARAASSYAIKLLDANNAYIARYLLDRGVFTGNDT